MGGGRNVARLRVLYSYVFSLPISAVVRRSEMAVTFAAWTRYDQHLVYHEGRDGQVADMEVLVRAAEGTLIHLVLRWCDRETRGTTSTSSTLTCSA